MKKYIAIVAGSVAVLFGLPSCGDNRMENITEDQVYISKSGEIEITASPLGQGEAKIDLWAVKSGNNGRSGNLRFVVDDALLREYNLGRDEQYQLSILPEDCYRLAETNFSVSPKNPSAPFEVYYDVDKIAEKYSDGRNYMLPLRLLSDDLPVNPSKDRALVIFDVISPRLGFMEFGSQIHNVKNADTEYSSLLNILSEIYSPLDVTVEIASDNQERVDEYNTRYNTNYILLPGEAYTISNKAPVLYEGEITLSIEVKVDSRKIPGGYYILPVEIAGADPFMVDDDRGVYYYVFNNYEEWLVTDGEKAGWSIVNASSNGADGGQGPLKIIDASTSEGYWGINYNASTFFDADGNLLPDQPQWIVIDLGETIDVGGIRWYPRPGSGAVMSHEFYISDQQPDTALYDFEWLTLEGQWINNSGYDYNENIWQKVGELINHGGASREVSFATTPARYIQVRLIAGPKASAMGEIDILQRK